MVTLHYVILFACFVKICCVCGDGIIDIGEECDDGNLRGFDGCDSNCQIERNFNGRMMYVCDGEPSDCKYKPPMGIPTPPFCVDFTKYDYEDMSGYYNWTNGPFSYFVNISDPDCTDSSTIDDRFDYNDNSNPGDPTKPRCTLPYALSAGDIVEIHGGPYEYSNYGGNKFGISGDGTADQPIIITGMDDALFKYRELHILGQYMIVERIVQGPTGLVQLRADYACIRHSEVFGEDIPDDGAAMTSYESDMGVFFHNRVHNRGCWWDETQENDYNGIGISANTHDIWAIDNHLWELGGDGVASCHACGYTTTHWYIGGNRAHRNGENAVDIKEVTDFVISENVGFDFEGWSAGSGGNGVAYVAHYGPANPPERLWFLGNIAYDMTGAGFAITGGVNDIYLIGNVIWNASMGFNSWSCEDQFIIGNTVVDCEIGMDYSGNEGDILTLENNIFMDIRTDDYIILDDSVYRDAAILEKNIFWRSSDDCAACSVEGTCVECMTVDPMFVDVENRDFHLLSDSPARNNATVSDVYQVFHDLYITHFTSLGDPGAADIRQDMDGKLFPTEEGSKWDIGAYQYSTHDRDDDDDDSDDDDGNNDDVTQDGSVSLVLGYVVGFVVLFF